MIFIVKPKGLNKKNDRTVTGGYLITDSRFFMNILYAQINIIISDNYSEWNNFDYFLENIYYQTTFF